MIDLRQTVLVTFLLTTCLAATPTKKCVGKALEPVKLEMGECNATPCTIKRNTTVPVDIHFKLDRDARELYQNVFANILSIPFPFIGVDGTSICDNIFDTDGVTKVNCPLKKDHVYRYLYTFKILDRYPKIDLEVHWSLNEKKNARELVCFELPSKITN